MFIPELTVTQKVEVKFLLQSFSGTVTQFLDFHLYLAEIEFDGTNLTLSSPVSVWTITDDLVEPDETIKIGVGLSSPSSIKDLVTFINQEAEVTIIDNNSEYACLCTTRYVSRKYFVLPYRHFGDHIIQIGLVNFSLELSAAT